MKKGILFKMKKKNNVVLIAAGIFLFVILAASCVYMLFKYRAGEDSINIINLKVCQVRNPLGIDEPVPTFSWQMESERKGACQSAYRICVAESKEALDEEKFCWDSGKVTGDISVGIAYNGENLEAKHRYFWYVEVWDEADKLYISEEEAWFETGLMEEGMSDAKWISAASQNTDQKYQEEEFVYSIAYQMEVIETTAAFIFGAGEGRYGEMYQCEIKNQGGEILFRLKHMNDSAVLSEEEADITQCADSDSGLFEVKLDINGENLKANINGIEIGEFLIEPTPAESIGYYKSRGTTYAWLDNIIVSSGNGTVLYQEAFEGDENIFSPYYVSVREGRLMVGSGLMLTKGTDQPAPLFRKEFQVQDKEIESARVYMTALGSFALSINGERVSENYFDPGKLAYNQQLSYVTYDVTEFLKQGENNALGIILLHGWYDRAVGYPEIWNPWGDKNALLGKMEIRFKDGSVEEIVTDAGFLYSLDGPVREDDLYQGEFYDANYELSGFDQAGFSEGTWYPAQENAVDEAYNDIPLVGKKNEPVTCVKVLEPVSITEPVENVFVYDFGQNFTGTCRISLTGEKGQIVTLRYGEELNGEDMLNKDDEVGTVWTENLLTAEATDYYVMKGSSEGETFEPEFVFHGFRYLQITGIEEALPAEQVEGIVLSSDLEQTGEFSCSNEALNQYYENTVWSQKSNFLDNPMDCPQRDERHGWAGDAQIFSLTASYHMNTYNFYEKYLNDLRSIQSEGGSFPDMAPRNFGTNWDGTGGAASNNCWGDAAVVITWNLYTQYGDQRIIEENYDALCKWVDMLINTSEQYIRSWGGYGDHLSLEDTPSDLSDTAWCAHSADLLSRMANVLGKQEDAEYYRQIYQNYKEAWQAQYVMPDGATSCNTQTSYALGLAFGLFPEELKEAAAEHLELLAEYSGYHINTGYSGVGYLLPVLSSSGNSETAYKMLLQEEYPSLLYEVNHGATTTWESFFAYQEEEEGYRLDGSLNHYAYGAPASWLYTDVLGIRSDELQPGFKHILLEPRIGGGLTFAAGSYTSTYGKISVEWKETENGYEYWCEIPANTTATLILPEIFGDNGEKVSYELSSGSYCFSQK